MARLIMADIVAKVQNRETPKISRNLISSRLHRCNTPYRPYEAPWSFLSETMWSPISPRAKRVSGSEKFWSSPQKDFFNTIGTFETCRRRQQCLFTGGFCCKSRKSNNSENLAKVDLLSSLLLRRYSTPLRRSVIDFG